MLTRLSQAKLQPYHQSAGLPDAVGGPIRTIAVKTTFLHSMILTLKFDEEPEALLGC